jgi:DNA processing protein
MTETKTSPILPESDDEILWHKISLCFEPGGNDLWHILKDKGFGFFKQSKKHSDSRLPSDEEYAKVISDCKRLGIGIITYNSPLYPKGLRELFNPPAALYYAGNIGAFSLEPSIGIVGSRNSSRYAVAVTEKLCRALLKYDPEYVFISGFAVGTDIAAHSAAIKNGGATIAVKACGIDYPYPEHHAIYYSDIIKNGLVISEYPPGTRPYPVRFPLRNRLIAALAGSVIVTEGGEHSGSLSTAHLAADFGKDVFVIPPCDITAPSCQGNVNLLREGALPVYGVRDILAQSPKFLAAVREAAMRMNADAEDTDEAVREAVERIAPLSPISLPDIIPDRHYTPTEHGKAILDLIKSEPGQYGDEDFAVLLGISEQDICDNLAELELYGYVSRSDSGGYEAN